MDVKIGQVWKRKQNGTLYKIADERMWRGTRDVQLVPLGKGRKSWKYDKAVSFSFELFEDVECTLHGK